MAVLTGGALISLPTFLFCWRSPPSVRGGIGYCDPRRHPVLSDDQSPGKNGPSSHAPSPKTTLLFITQIQEGVGWGDRRKSSGIKQAATLSFHSLLCRTSCWLGGGRGIITFKGIQFHKGEKLVLPRLDERGNNCLSYQSSLEVARVNFTGYCLGKVKIFLPPPNPPGLCPI